MWPENAETVAVFMRLGTQWNHGMAGVTGLAYGSIEPILRMLCVPKKRWLDIFEGVRVMEAAVLELRAEAAKRG